MGGVLNDIVDSGPSGFFDQAASQAPESRSRDLPDAPLGCESPYDRDRELPGIGTRSPQAQNLVDSPQVRAQQSDSKDQTGRSARFFQLLVKFAQLRHAGIALALPQREHFRIQHD